MLSILSFFLRILDLNGTHLLLPHSLPHSHAVRDNDLGSRSQGQPQSPDLQRSAIWAVYLCDIVYRAEPR